MASRQGAGDAIGAELQAVTHAETSRRISAMRYGKAVARADTEDKVRQVAKAWGYPAAR